jgi:hypothetical protein
MSQVLVVVPIKEKALIGVLSRERCGHVDTNRGETRQETTTAVFIMLENRLSRRSTTAMFMLEKGPSRRTTARTNERRGSSKTDRKKDTQNEMKLAFPDGARLPQNTEQLFSFL